MKRILIALVLACVTGVAAYAIFCRALPENKKFDCEIKWLSHKLSLSSEQTERVRAIHVKYCPSMNGLGAKVKSCSNPDEKTELKQACAKSTAKLVEEVCAVLTPAQRAEYLRLLDECKQRQQQQKP
ncbi:MAG: hypothetical protein QM790_10910 [Nibricoccus sp.]